MPRPALALVLLLLAGGCGDDMMPDDEPGLAGDCASAGGTLLGCDTGPIENAADACAKLMDCGAIPLVHEWYYDREACEREIRRLSDDRQELVLACIEASSCDLLRGDLDLCLEGSLD